MCSNAASFACGPYDVPNALIDSYVVYTDNPPCGAMRGFGAVQTCFAHEAQMDKLAAVLEMDPVELRRRNALAEGGTIPTGAKIRCPAPVVELLDSVSARPLPPPSTAMPGGHANTTHGEGVRRGSATPSATRTSATRGLRRLLDRARAAVGGGRRAAGRGPHGGGRGRPGARDGAGADRAPRARRRARARAARRHAGRLGRLLVGLAPDLHDRRRGQARVRGGREELERRGPGALVDLIGDEPIDVTREHHHRPTFPLDEKGQGDAHVTFAFAAHRAVVDVDTELGLVRVVEIATAQDVGKAINPQAVEGRSRAASRRASAWR